MPYQGRVGMMPILRAAENSATFRHGTARFAETSRSRAGRLSRSHFSPSTSHARDVHLLITIFAGPLTPELPSRKSVTWLCLEAGMLLAWAGGRRRGAGAGAIVATQPPERRATAASSRPQLVTFLPERPPYAPNDLRNPDRPCQRGPLMQLMHQLLPRSRPSLPGQRILLRMHHRHHAVANQNHRGKVLPSPGCQEHRATSLLSRRPCAPHCWPPE